ncbi:MAG TPA: sigma-54 dependent transcriptional regulator [Acidobacteriota bacterium]|nr:sigma-54 dependent transcriptional regulator [Acidobacteriota bacterium]
MAEAAQAVQQPSVLVLEDDIDLTSALRDYLQDEGWEVESASTAGEARSKLTEQVFDLVLADYLLPDADGLTVFEEIQSRCPMTKVMIMTGVKDMEVAARAFKKGAADLISKPFKVNELGSRIDELMEEKRRQLETDSNVVAFRKPRSMVGRSASMKKVFRLMELVAGRSQTVLISGESGTGKELVARAIHNQSPRAKAPFVAINCGAIPENLLEDELFGHIRGAYTDARQSRIGKFEQANGGTLFLDEIGTMPMNLQIKLLRVLEEREFQKLGSNQTVRVDVRILAATNANLRKKVEDGEFREDLFYRLNVVPIQLPALHERKDDIPLLVNHFLKLVAQEDDEAERKISPAALKLLMAHKWPGNVREMRNVLELACVLAGEDQVLDVEHFPSLFGGEAGEGITPEGELLKNYLQLPNEGINLNQVVSELEKNLICQSLKRTQGNKGKAARLLNLKRTTLVEKLRRMNLLEDFSAS